jgi:hypothetical protein
MFAAFGTLQVLGGVDVVKELLRISEARYLVRGQPVHPHRIEEAHDPQIVRIQALLDRRQTLGSIVRAQGLHATARAAGRDHGVGGALVAA